MHLWCTCDALASQVRHKSAHKVYSMCHCTMFHLLCLEVYTFCCMRRFVGAQQQSGWITSKVLRSFLHLHFGVGWEFGVVGGQREVGEGSGVGESDGGRVSGGWMGSWGVGKQQSMKNDYEKHESMPYRAYFLNDKSAHGGFGLAGNLGVVSYILVHFREFKVQCLSWFWAGCMGKDT